MLVISDGTGETAEKVVRAGLRQFQGHVVHVRTYASVSTAEHLLGLFRIAARRNALVITTLVKPGMAELADRYAKEHGVRHVDLLQNLLLNLGAYLDAEPAAVPGLMHRADDRYFKRIEAVEFTVKADDGKEPRMLRGADIILVGVSRTSKTPLSTFLAHKGFKVGNVPIVLDHDLPPWLFEVDPRRVFALTIGPDALQSIRSSRLRAMGVGVSNYDDRDYILAELEYANDLFRAHPEWPLIDVTNKAIEETAATILQVMRDRGLAEPFGDPSQL
ncbi:MAG: kinase/pyrophosphorylase [Alphaproteobacteria bacterium]|nr:kinase/pyrophosphorylase [Alphaproteobacteria bacterium]MCB9690367.1 kinase/pyrophosphorylase [Alphaproteobacteria bacterium]